MTAASEMLDARGLLCPLPVIRTQERVRNMPSGATLTVVATDPGVRQDIPAWCRVHGHRVIDISEEGNDVLLCIEIG